MATHRDMCHFMVQDREYTGFQKNTTCLHGRGPTLLETRRKAEELFIQQCKENIEKGNIAEEIPNDQEEIFVPNKRARHRVPKTFSSASPTQKKSKPNVQKTNNNPNQGTKKKSVQEQKEQKDNSEDEDSDIEQMSRVPHAKEEAQLNANPLEIVFINGNLTKCSGCYFRYQDNEQRERYDLVFKIRMHQMRPFRFGTIWARSNRKTLAFFHLWDMACVKSVEELKQRNISKKDIYMTNKTLSELSPMHIHLLKELKHRQFIRQN